MPPRMLTLTGWLLALAALAGSANIAAAQFREQPRPEVRAPVKSVDAAAGTITVMTFTGRDRPAEEKTYKLAKNAEVVTFTARFNLFKEIKLGDITPGSLVAMTLAADQQTIESLAAEAPMVRGQVKMADGVKKTLTVALGGSRDRGEEEKTFTLAPDAEILIDDGTGRRTALKAGTIGDLGDGSFVQLRLTLDQKQIQSIVAEPPILNGTIKTVDAAKKTFTLVTRPARGDDGGEEHTLSLAADAVVLLDDGRGRRLSVKEGKLDNVPAGSMAMVRLTNDRGAAQVVRVEGAVLTGQLKAVDADKGVVTLAIPKGRGEEPDQKSLPLAKDARVMLDGTATQLANLKAGDEGQFVQLRLSLDQKSVQAVLAFTPRQRQE